MLKFLAILLIHPFHTYTPFNIKYKSNFFEAQFIYGVDLYDLLIILFKPRKVKKKQKEID